MPVRGDYVKLRGLSSALRTLPPRAKAAAIRAAHETFQGLVVDGFDAERAPDGTAWPPRKDDRAGPLLVQSERLRDAIASPNAIFLKQNGFVMQVNVPYAAVHNHGAPARHIPPRPFLPRGGEVPAAWNAAMKYEAEMAMLVVLDRTRFR